MAIDVTVTEQCKRCKRKEQVTISSDKVAEFEAKAEATKAHEQAVIDFVEANQGKLPDLVVIFKGKTQMLSSVCDAYCAKTVQNGVDVLFREHKPRKPRTQKTPEEKAANKAAKEAKAKAEADKAAKDSKKK
jgi:uncharacterized metal-binding protein YceD (DUF177 family)